MDTIALLEKANHYREMAMSITDKKARDALLELAAEYEDQAEKAVERRNKLRQKE